MARPPARSTAGADAARAGLKMPRATWSARSGRQRDQWSGRLADDTEKKRDEEPKSVTHVSGINGAHVSGMDPGNIGGDGVRPILPISHCSCYIFQLRLPSYPSFHPKIIADFRRTIANGG